MTSLPRSDAERTIEWLKADADNRLKEYYQRIVKVGSYGLHGDKTDKGIANFVFACVALAEYNAIDKVIRALRPFIKELPS